MRACGTMICCFTVATCGTSACANVERPRVTYRHANSVSTMAARTSFTACSPPLHLQRAAHLCIHSVQPAPPFTACSPPLHSQRAAHLSIHSLKPASACSPPLLHTDTPLMRRYHPLPEDSAASTRRIKQAQLDCRLLRSKHQSSTNRELRALRECVMISKESINEMATRYFLSASVCTKRYLR